MKSVAFLRRTVALHLLVVIPAVIGARVSLDAPWELRAHDHIEAEHCTCCSKAHDHALCALLLNSPWSADVSTAHQAFIAPPTRHLPAGENHRLEGGPFDLKVARSPPHS